ncbi:RcnB family protein [Acinetobacter sp.]|uniref:RcnB family protein n=1 Tax=Acinetobacter sp. TaxID=472 RepID=UPI002648F1FA|nr:RcnB family protein [Acinetobacter sp.]MDN5511648.1 RcnB family protein [Acinetobacter sp.]MDN5523484.1 RcnB family protein [Acinetobacter sp.]
MKKVLTTIALSLSALMATSAMAAPDHRYDDHRYNNAPAKPVKHDDHRWDNNNRYDHNRYDNKRVNPSRDWRSGQSFPRVFSSSGYKVSDREARRLPDTGRYQQWYKVNGDYVLVNERTDRIVRIIN